MEMKTFQIDQMIEYVAHDQKLRTALTVCEWQGAALLYIRRQAFGIATPYLHKFGISEFTLCTAPKAQQIYNTCNSVTSEQAMY